MKRLVLTHLLGNALLLLLVYYWLGLGMAPATTVAWSAVVALSIVAAGCWIHGAAFAGSFRTALRHLPATMVVALLAIAAYVALPSDRTWTSIARWIVLPAVFVPFFAGAATHGWRVRRGLSLRALAAPAFVALGVWVPLRLLAWAPRVSGFSMEMASFVLRAGAAYLLFTGAWLALAFITSAGRPRFTQPKTVSLP